MKDKVSLMLVLTVLALVAISLIMLSGGLNQQENDTLTQPVVLQPVRPPYYAKGTYILFPDHTIEGRIENVDVGPKYTSITFDYDDISFCVIFQHTTIPIPTEAYVKLYYTCVENSIAVKIENIEVLV
jgi:hypothetical protein